MIVHRRSNTNETAKDNTTVSLDNLKAIDKNIPIQI